MAKILYGESVAQMSGSVGGTVHSRNRYGSYLRQRVHPTIATSIYAQRAKGVLSTVSSMWSEVDEDDRTAWESYAANTVVMDRLGFTQHLDGHAMFVRINGLLMSAGQDPLALPVMGDVPLGSGNLVLSALSGVQTLSLTASELTLAAGEVLEVWGCAVDKPTQKYVVNKLRRFFVSAKAATSPFNLLSDWTDRFGVLIEGTTVRLSVRVIDTATGLASRFWEVSALVAVS